MMHKRLRRHMIIDSELPQLSYRFFHFLEAIFQNAHAIYVEYVHGKVGHHYVHSNKIPRSQENTVFNTVWYMDGEK